MERKGRSRKQLCNQIREKSETHAIPGLAMKLGMIPCFIPTLLAVYLNRIALSAILSAEV